MGWLSRILLRYQLARVQGWKGNTRQWRILTWLAAELGDDGTKPHPLSASISAATVQGALSPWEEGAVSGQRTSVPPRTRLVNGTIAEPLADVPASAKLAV